MYAQQPGGVSNGPNARRSEISVEFLRNVTFQAAPASIISIFRIVERIRQKERFRSRPFLRVWAQYQIGR